MSETSFDPVSEFTEIYGTREALKSQVTSATPIGANLFKVAIFSADERLALLAEEEEVQAHLAKIGGLAVKGMQEIEELEKTGLIPGDVIAAKKAELEVETSKPGAAMAIEFLHRENLSLVPEARKPRLATEPMVTFAQSLGLDVTNETSRRDAKKLIDAEVKKLSRRVLKSGEYAEYDVLLHPKHGECEVSKIHEKTLLVTLAPVDGSRKFVVKAMRLPDFKRVTK